jgi:hypothetical protein
MLRCLLAILVCLVSLEVACGRLPRLTDRRAAEPEEIRKSPAVVAALIWNDRPARPGFELELRRLSVAIENVLKGDLRPGPADIYYYADRFDRDDPRPLGMWQTGDRRIFYLRPEGGVLHTACDGHDDCTIPLGTGSHAGFRPDPRRPVDYAIAELLLTRGDGVTDEQFARSIEHKVPARPVNFVIDRLQRLAAGSGPVREAACKQLRYMDRTCGQ